MILARKQAVRDAAAWQAARANASLEWPDDRLDALIHATVTHIRETTRGQRTAIAWSGGKDSLALELLARQAGITDAVLAVCHLEVPATLAWVDQHAPDDLTIVNTGQDLDWLAKNPAMLFPQGQHGARWYVIVNHRGQERYFHDRGLDLLLLGRRRRDGNYCGPGGSVVYTNRRGVTHYSPLADWPHEAVFALLDRHGVQLPPCYGWPRGWQIGTGPWPARQWTHSVDHGWSEIWQIDPGIVHQAATTLPSAAYWLAHHTTDDSGA